MDLALLVTSVYFMFPVSKGRCGVISFSYMSRKFEPKILSETYLSHLIYSSSFFQPLAFGVGFFGCVMGVFLCFWFCFILAQGEIKRSLSPSLFWNSCFCHLQSIVSALVSSHSHAQLSFGFFLTENRMKLTQGRKFGEPLKAL